MNRPTHDFYLTSDDKKQMFTWKIFKQNTDIMGIIHETFKPNKNTHKLKLTRF
jgi:hypothetical protein